MRKAAVRCFSVPLIAWMAASAATLPVKTYTTAGGLAEPFRGEEIARFIGLRSPKTLRRHFREELDRAATEANAQVPKAYPGANRYGRGLYEHCIFMPVGLRSVTRLITTGD